MAEESEDLAAGPAESEAADELEFVDWTCRLLSLERVEADEIEDDLEDLFTATFAVDGPDANAEVEIIVSDFEDEAHVIGIALDTLHRAMKAWGHITENRRIASRDVDELKGE